MPYASGCIECGGTAQPNASRCTPCAEYRRATERDRRDYRRKHQLCLTCGEPVARTKLIGGAAHKRVREHAAYCTRHLNYYAARFRAAKGAHE